MLRFHLGLMCVVLSAGYYAGCGDTTSPCATMECPSGTVCNEDTGACLCGTALCGAAEICSAENTCEPELCVGMMCDEGHECSALDGLCYCGETTCEEGQICEADSCIWPLPEAICETGGWSPGTGAFREATAEWGLLGVEGVRLNVADIDGDARPDLLVRRGAQGLEDFGVVGTRRTWLLQNRNGRFEDITETSGLLQFRGEDLVGQGRPVQIVAFADVDNDGDQDVYLGLATSNRDMEETGMQRSEILLNNGDGTFSLGPESDVRSPRRWDAPAGASFLDYDQDGQIDLWVPEHNFTADSGSLVFLGDRLYRGDGSGGFSEVTEAAGLVTEGWNSLEDLDGGLAHSRAWGSLARDLDGDGLSELLVPSYGRSPNHLWRALAGGTFRNESVSSGYAFDMDQSWQDNQFAACFCQSSPAASGCDEVMIVPRIGCGPNWNHDQDRHPFRLGGNSGATSAGDVDNDGDLDLFTGEIKHWWAGGSADGSELLINDGNATFSRPGNAATGLGVPHAAGESWDEGHMTSQLFDFDNDGRLDVYIGASDYPGNRGRLFHQEASGMFAEVAIADFFEHRRSHGVVVADFDQDGDLDIIVGHSRARCGGTTDCYETAQVRAFENITPATSFIQVRVGEAEGSNAAAIGAQVWVTPLGTRRESEIQLQEVDGGHGHYGSQSDRTLHFGLAGACEARVRVRWPNADNTEQTFTLPAGHRFLLTPRGPRVLD